MISTMFLNDLTVVDHAYITEHGDVRGGSFNPSFLVEGEIDPVEKVVVDFSTIKKQLKQFIDDKELGFDHKLWVINGLSNITSIEVDGVLVTDFADLLDHKVYSSTSNVTILTPTVTLNVPKNAVKFIDPDHCEYTIDNVGKWLSEYLNDCFGGNVTVTCHNTINAHTLLPVQVAPIGYFTYAHGLKDSTSWGCQNIAHGHLSFIQLVGSATPDVQREIISMITADLDGTVFINKENVVVETAEHVGIKYTTPRGSFTGLYEKFNPRAHNICKTVIAASPAHCVILDSETTIEFLVEYVKSEYSNIFKKFGITAVMVSEGLSKGAYVTIE